MKLKACDSCGGPLATASGRDVFWVVKVQIMKATAWGPVERARAERIVDMEGNTALGKALADVEPAEIPGRLIPSLVTNADLRICAKCVEHGPTAVQVDGGEAGIDILALVRASEIGGSRVPTPETA